MLLTLTLAPLLKWAYSLVLAIIAWQPLSSYVSLEQHDFEAALKPFE